eukprot:7175251-Alexandrium_andersonii.AAC.1
MDGLEWHRRRTRTRCSALVFLDVGADMVHLTLIDEKPFDGGNPRAAKGRGGARAHADPMVALYGSTARRAVRSCGRLPAQ